MPDHAPGTLTELDSGTFTSPGGGISGDPVRDAEYLVLEVATAPEGAGQQVGGEATRWFGWGWVVVGTIDFGRQPTTFLGSGTAFPVLLDLHGVHKNTIDCQIRPGWVLNWRLLG